MNLLFLDISTGELLIIFIAFLLLFGAKSIPDLAQNLGQFIFYAKRTKDDIQKEVFKSTEKINHYVQTTRQEIEENIKRQEDKIDIKTEEPPKKSPIKEKKKIDTSHLN